MLGEAVLAIDRPVSAGRKRYFTFFLAVGANRLVHLPRATEASPGSSKSTVSHDKFSSRKGFHAGEMFLHRRISPH
ncbi:hypothetical protein RCIA62 [Methanocella arvoryzae MRE50]|uniref:Uncharacterized protein n=1 Tax=Methanocella arvoryzae (strain DSM 22066 / NBRC 105507 / MRE50) TaxID=351160 RepID=Q0W5D5_METAR|nr:hypothetical protein RCIA62 [Methanocella arvoryzae MRE50]